MEYRYFTFDEFACSETGENEMKPIFILALDMLRAECGFPFVITSGYRSPEHSIEKKKDKLGMHTTGMAADIAVRNGAERRKLVEKALKAGMGGIGVAKTFVHVDARETNSVMWVY